MHTMLGANVSARSGENIALTLLSWAVLLWVIDSCYAQRPRSAINAAPKSMDPIA
jgi:hypothetical protein